MAKSRYADATKAARRAAMSAHTKARLRRMLVTPTRPHSRLPVLPPSPPATPVATS